MLIRAARAGDIDALLQLQSVWPSLPRWTRGHLESELDGGRLIVAEEGKGILGFGALRIVAPEAEVTLVAVEPDQVRRGIARKLMERLHALAIDAHCEIMGLEVSAANEPAIGLYQGLGYTTVGRRARYYPDGSDALLMSRRLTAR